MRFLFLFVISLLSISVFADEPDKDLHRKCLYPVIAVLDQTTNFTGTGVVVRSDCLEKGKHINVALTAAHVLPESGESEQVLVGVYRYKDWSTLETSYWYSCVVHALDRDRDLAVLLFGTETSVPAAELGVKEKLYIGTKIVQVGCGLGHEPRVEHGHITNLHDTRNPDAPLKFSSNTIPGDSGAPLLVNNRVVGIVQSIRGTNIEGQRHVLINMGNAIPLSILTKWNEEEDGMLDFVFDDQVDLPIKIVRIRER